MVGFHFGAHPGSPGGSIDFPYWNVSFGISFSLAFYLCSRPREEINLAFCVFLPKLTPTRAPQHSMLAPIGITDVLFSRQ